MVMTSGSRSSRSVMLVGVYSVPCFGCLFGSVCRHHVTRSAVRSCKKKAQGIIRVISPSVRIIAATPRPVAR